MIKSLQSFAQTLTAREPPVSLIMASDKEDQKRALSYFKGGTYFSRMNGAAFLKERFIEESEQSDLFVKKKLLVIEEAHLLKKEEFIIISTYLKRVNPHLTLVLLASEKINFPKLIEVIEEEGVVLTLLEEKVWDKKARLVHEALHYLKQEGVGIDAKLCAYFIELQGLDQSTIRQELDKLLCFIGNKNQVTKEDIEAISTSLFSQTIWNLVDAIFQRNCAAAISIGSQLLAESSLFSLLATLRGQVRNGIEILTLYEQEGKEAITKRYSYLKGALLEKKLALLEGYGLESLLLCARAFFDSELQLRDSNQDEDLVLELLCIRLCLC